MKTFETTEAIRTMYLPFHTKAFIEAPPAGSQREAEFETLVEHGFVKPYVYESDGTRGYASTRKGEDLHRQLKIEHRTEVVKQLDAVLKPLIPAPEWKRGLDVGYQKGERVMVSMTPFQAERLTQLLRNFATGEENGKS